MAEKMYNTNSPIIASPAILLVKEKRNGAVVALSYLNENFDENTQCNKLKNCANHTRLLQFL